MTLNNKILWKGCSDCRDPALATGRILNAKTVISTALKMVKISSKITVEAEVVKHGMCSAVAAGQAVVSEAGHLKIASLEHYNRAR